MKEHVPNQLCPKCNGQGTVSKPPYVPGDVNQWTASCSSFQCDVCEGKKIIPMIYLEVEGKERLTPEEKQFLHNVYGRLWIEAYYDHNNEHTQKFAIPLAEMMQKANETLKFNK